MICAISEKNVQPVTPAKSATTPRRNLCERGSKTLSTPRRRHVVRHSAMHGVWTLPAAHHATGDTEPERHDATRRRCHILLPMLTEGKPKRAYLFPALEGQYHRCMVLPVGSSCCIFRSPALQVDTTHASFGRQHRGFSPPPRTHSRHSPPRPLGVCQVPDQLRSARTVSSGAKPIAPRSRAHTRPAHVAMSEEAFARFLLSCRPPLDPPPLYASRRRPTPRVCLSALLAPTHLSALGVGCSMQLRR